MPLAALWLAAALAGGADEAFWPLALPAAAGPLAEFAEIADPAAPPDPYSAAQPAMPYLLLAGHGARARLVARELRGHADSYGLVRLHDPRGEFEPGAWALRGSALRPGPAIALDPGGALAPGRTRAFALANGRWRLVDGCAGAAGQDCELRLEHAGRRQVLAHWRPDPEWPGGRGYALNFQVEFAGDLDRDGRLDLVLGASAYREAGCAYRYLLLSGVARTGDLVGLAAHGAACD